MSKKRRHTKEKRLSTDAVMDDIFSTFHREYPTDPRLIVIGLVLLLMGGILYVLANRFAWGGWIGAVVNFVDMPLLVTGIVLIFATMMGRIRGD